MKQTNLGEYFTGIKGIPVEKKWKSKLVKVPEPRILIAKSEGRTIVEVSPDKQPQNSSSISQFFNDVPFEISINKPKQSSSPVKKNPNLVNFPMALTPPQRLSQTKYYDSDSDATIIASPVTSPQKIRTPFETLASKRKLFVEVSSDSEDEEPPNKIVRHSDFSPKATPQSPQSPNKSLNLTYLNAIREFIHRALLANNLKYLIAPEDVRLLKKFLGIDCKSQYTCVKLFTTWKRIWYNVFKFCQKINLEMDSGEIQEMYDRLGRKGFVLTDYGGMELQQLLNLLELKDVRDIFQSFKLKGSHVKGVMIEKLLKHCGTQSTLTLFKSSEEILRERIKHKMGQSMKISDKFYDCLFRVYLLNTFTNDECTDPSAAYTFFAQRHNFPKYEVQEYRVFETTEEFAEYAEGVRCYNELQKAFERKDNNKMFDICMKSYEVLKRLKTDDNRLPYLRRFTASAQHTSVLNFGIKHLTSSHFDELASWLWYLLDQKVDSSRRCFWYCQLSLIQTTYFKDYEAAANTLLDALRKHKRQEETFSEVQLHDLAARCKVLNKKTYKLPKKYFDEMLSLTIPSCDNVTRPSIVIERYAVRNDKAGSKRLYVKTLPDGEKIYMSVEETAIEHYASSGYPSGRHCEGSLIASVFSLLFWDIIYDVHVDGTFLSQIQSFPLDMLTKHFYPNREDHIDRRLKDIRTGWTDLQFDQKIIDNFNEHRHEMGLTKIDAVVDDPAELCDIVCCIGRSTLAGILERLVKNYREYHSGFPDLLLWNVQTKKAKFVEVKGQNDVLSIKQKLWLNYLIAIGADAEVCHVHSIGTKKKRDIEDIEKRNKSF